MLSNRYNRDKYQVGVNRLYLYKLASILPLRMSTYAGGGVALSAQTYMELTAISADAVILLHLQLPLLTSSHSMCIAIYASFAI